MSVLSIDSLPTLRIALNALFDPVYIADRDYNILWANRAYRQAFGYRARKRFRCYEVAQMDICRTEACVLERASSGAQRVLFTETSLAGMRQDEASFLAGGLPLTDPDSGEVVAVVGLLRDNSDEVRVHARYKQILEEVQRQNELLEQKVQERTAELVGSNEALARSNAELSRSQNEIADILRNISQAILTIDDSLVVSGEYSKFSETLFGRRDLEGTSLLDLLTPGQARADARKELEEWLKLVFHSPTLDWSKARNMPELEHTIERPDGETVELLVEYEPIREQGRVKRVMVLAQDLTELRRLERSLEEKDREMAESIEQIAELARLDPEMYEALFEEADDIISRSKTILAGLRDAADPAALIDEMFRDMHTLKGNAMSFGLVRAAAKAHWVEDAFSTLRAAASDLSGGLVAEATEKVRDLGDLFDRIKQMAGRLVSGASRDSAAVRADDVGAKLEVPRAQVESLCAWAESNVSGDDRVKHELLSRIRSLGRVPLSRLGGRLAGMVDDLAHARGKSVQRLTIEGGDIAVEGKIFSKLSNVLVHLVRNAVDHGLEAPQERLAQGKPRAGNVWLRAYLDDADLCVSVKDDGRGIDAEEVIARAKQRGLLDRAARPDVREALRLVFVPGISTAESLSDVSGRGIGMDAVKATVVEELGGSIDIDAERGRGTRVSLRFRLETDGSPPARAPEPGPRSEPRGD